MVFVSQSLLWSPGRVLSLPVIENSPSLISNKPRQMTVSPVLYLCCLTLETWVEPLEFRWYHVYKLRFVQLNFQSRLLGFLTSACLLLAYCHRYYNTSGVSVHKYSGVTVRISFLASEEQGYTMRSGCSLFLFTTSGFEPSYGLTDER